MLDRDYIYNVYRKRESIQLEFVETLRDENQTLENGPKLLLLQRYF